MLLPRVSIIKKYDNQIKRITKHFSAFITTLNGSKTAWEVAKIQSKRERKREIEIKAGLASLRL